MEVENLKNLKKIVEKSFEDLGKKTDISPAEIKAAKDGGWLIDWLDMKIEECEMKEGYSERDSYGHHMDYPHRSYDGGMANRSMRSYGYDRMDDPRYAGDYGVHGWYRSNNSGDMYPHNYGPDMSGYSRHSINDRAVDQLERLMDTAGSEYEREQLHRFIRMIRQAE